ncbi:unnamed protein product [Ambrosiozyma monospora]|uniref:Unnamed protein product n=1 Tax=Ambrosiozyma monospora TaxID=43982 RepID=A0ACB5T7Y8_AMBMO|nr:unnamed protein product [Ambrosiozyma monospora]
MMHLSNIDEITSPASQNFHDSHESIGPVDTTRGYQSQTPAPTQQQPRQFSQCIPRPQERKTSMNNSNGNNNNNNNNGSSLFKKNWYLRKLSATSASSSSNPQDASDGSAMSMGGSGPNSGVTTASSNTPVKKQFDVQDTRNKSDGQDEEEEEEELDLMDMLRMGPSS